MSKWLYIVVTREFGEEEGAPISFLHTTVEVKGDDAVDDEHLAYGVGSKKLKLPKGCYALNDYVVALEGL